MTPAAARVLISYFESKGKLGPQDAIDYSQAINVVLFDGIQKLQDRVRELEKTLSDLASTLMPVNPDVQQLEKRLSTLEKHFSSHIFPPNGNHG